MPFQARGPFRKMSSTAATSALDGAVARAVDSLEEWKAELEEAEEQGAEAYQDEWKERWYEERYEVENGRFAVVDEWLADGLKTRRRRAPRPSLSNQVGGTMKANEVKLADLLVGTVQYRVPLFQRRYSWGNAEWDQLWKDLSEIYGSDDGDAHFIGAVVTAPVDPAPERAAKFLLIDGQQRLTTILVMLKALGDVATDENNGHVRELIDRHLRNLTKFPEERQKLVPTQDDRAGFAAILGANGLESRFKDAYQRFRSRYAEGDEQGQPFDLDRLVTAVLFRLELVSVRLEASDSPHRIFESLNSKGMDLTAADLIRNHVFMRLANDSLRQEAVYTELWRPMEQQLGDHFTGFFWRYLMMDGSLTAWDQIFTAFRAKFSAVKDKGIEAYLKELGELAAAYRRIVAPAEAENDAVIRERMERLNRWELDTAYPYLLRLFRARSADEVSPSVAADVLSALESFAVRRSVCGVPTNRLRRIFASLASKFEASNALDQCHAHLASNDWPTDERFKAVFVTFNAYLRSRVVRTNMMLGRLERSFWGKEKVVVGENVTIEHVMPQTLDDGWREALGPEHMAVHETWLHTIGNLTLSSYNSELGNKPFPEKRDILKESGFAMNRTIAEADDWTAARIEERGHGLAEIAVKVWARP